jgi:rSAM/selenodomain-associated transferase 2
LRISVIIPTLNEAAALPSTLAAVAGLDGLAEVIVADGGSSDDTRSLAAPLATVICTDAGRGPQQAAGAALATGEVLWFLHADCLPDPAATRAIREALADPSVAGGNFTLQFAGSGRAARTLTRAYPWFRLLGLCYGDSGIFVRRESYDAVGGFRPLPLFEDIDLVRRIRRQGRFRRVRCGLTASARRFEHRNFAGMFAQWTGLQILYWLGVSPSWLARRYALVRERS